MRGTPAGFLSRGVSAGIIPAYAGNTGCSGLVNRCSRDHPRVCGEHRIPNRGRNMLMGSSPRMRGTPIRRRFFSVRRGIIPAYAGNTGPSTPPASPLRDHPRVCGEHASTPRPCLPISGSSPRMRGTPAGFLSRGVSAGIIPAYAGNTGHVPVRMGDGGDHPRVCGEHRRQRLHAHRARLGSSPRMRGTPIPMWLSNGEHGIIPAYAGNTLRDYSNFVVSKFMSFVFHLV